MALRNAVALPQPGRTVMPLLQLLLAALALALGIHTRRHPLRHSQAQPVIAGGIVLVGLFLPLEQTLTQHGLLAANLGLVIVAAGALLVSTRSFAAAVGSLLVAWLLAVASHAHWDVPVTEQALLLFAATALAVAVHVLRVSGRRDLLAALEQVVEIALRDALTGLWNRHGAREATRALIGQARLEDQPVWCVFLDVRGLKGVNDVLGHAEGDRLLLAVGRALAPYADAGVVPVRWGGDEFCLFGQGPAPDVSALAAELRRACERSLGAVDQPWGISAGLGVSRTPERADVMDRLVRRADEDMYHRRRGAAATS